MPSKPGCVVCRWVFVGHSDSCRMPAANTALLRFSRKARRLALRRSGGEPCRAGPRGAMTAASGLRSAAGAAGRCSPHFAPRPGYETSGEGPAAARRPRRHWGAEVGGAQVRAGRPWGSPAVRGWEFALRLPRPRSRQSLATL